MTLDVSVRHAFAGFDLDVTFSAPDGITVLFGRSGTGKTTVVNAVAGLLRPDAGRIRLHDTVLSDSETGIWTPVHRRRIGYVFQDARLFPHMRVAQNLRYGQRFHRGGLGDTERVIDLLGLAPLLDRAPADLSGGETQRVAIGRALLSAPRLLLMDEPLAALDGARKAQILPYLERLRDEVGIPILYVSHAVAEVARLASNVVLLENGRVVRQGAAADVLSDPEMVRRIGIREAGAVLNATVAAHHDDGLSELSVSKGRLLLPRVDAAIGAPTRVRILAQDVILARTPPEAISALNILPVRVLALRGGDGPGVIVQLAMGPDRLLARITRRSADALALAPGDAVHAIVKSVSIARVDIGGG